MMIQFPVEVGNPESHKMLVGAIIVPSESINEEFCVVDREPPTHTEVVISDETKAAVDVSFTAASLPPDDPPSNQFWQVESAAPMLYDSDRTPNPLKLTE
jgi:hypothetical protein